MRDLLDDLGAELARQQVVGAEEVGVGVEVVGARIGVGLGHRRPRVDRAPGGPGLPDGMCLDTDGRLYATGPGGVLVLTPDAQLLGVIETGTAIANCAFGEDGRTLFLASNHTLTRVRLKTTGLVW